MVAIAEANNQRTIAMLTDDEGNPIHAPKPNPPSIMSLPFKVTRTTRNQCHNIFKGLFWVPDRPGSSYGPCTHPDDSEYQRQLDEWEEKQAEFLERLRENDL